VEYDVGRHARACGATSERHALRMPSRAGSPVFSPSGGSGCNIARRRDLVRLARMREPGWLLAQHHLGLAFQHAAPRGVRQTSTRPKASLSGCRWPQGPPVWRRGGTPLLFIEFGADAEHGKSCSCPNCLTRSVERPNQDIDQMHRAENAARCDRRRTKAFLRDDFAIAKQRPATGSCRNCRIWRR